MCNCRIITLVVMAAAFLHATAGAQTRGVIEGVWRTAERIESGPPNARSTKNPQPSLLIFTKKHYSVMSIESNEPLVPTPFKTAGQPTDAEKLARYEMLSRVYTSTGTYTFDGKTLIRTPIIFGADPRPPLNIREVMFESQDTIWISAKHDAGGGLRVKFARVE